MLRILSRSIPQLLMLAVGVYLLAAWMVILEWQAWALHVLSLAAGLALLAIITSSGLPRRWNYGILFALLVPLWMVHTMELQSYFIQGSSFNERYYSHIDFSTWIAAFSSYPLQSIGSCLLLILLLGLNGAAFAALQWRVSVSKVLLAGLLLVLLLQYSVPLSFSAMLGSIRQSDLSVNQILDKYSIDGAFVAPSQLTASPGKNLVFLYLESVEYNYLNEDVFPDLLPNIKGLLGRSANWSRFHQINGTSWTIGGLYTSQCGLPLLSVSPGNQIVANIAGSKLSCIGDVLDEAGYTQVFMGGATTTFAGKENFFFAHKYDEVLGKAQHLAANPDLLLTPWGLFDKDLLELAKRKYLELSNAAQPFNLTLLTMDTHHPRGHVDDRCRRYPHADNTMLHAVHCTDQLVGDFVEFLQAQDNASDTVVFVMSDHLGIDTILNEDVLRAGKWRRIMAFTPTPARGPVEMDKLTTHVDVPAIVLDLMSVESNVTFPFSKEITAGNRKLALKAIDFHDKDLQADIRKVFAELNFSPAHVCSSRISFTNSGSGNKSINVGGIKKEFLTAMGEPANVGGNQMLAMRIGADGSMMDVEILPEPQLSAVFGAGEIADSYYLVASESDSFPAWLGAPVADQAYSAYLGNPYLKDTGLIMGADKLWDIEISRQDCDAVFASAKTDDRFW